jgi:hypothetical protein
MKTTASHFPLLDPSLVNYICSFAISSAPTHTHLSHHHIFLLFTPHLRGNDTFVIGYFYFFRFDRI